MKQFVRSRKWAWNICFWILFFLIVFFILTEPEILGIPKTYFSFFLGMLLIINRVYLVKGRIKRLPYFLSLLALFAIPVTLLKILSSLKIFPEFFFLIAIIFSTSYFSGSGFIMLAIAVEINNLTKDILDLEAPFNIIYIFTPGVLCLAIFYPFVVLHIKRLRDIKFSSWWTLLTLIPVINILFEIFLCIKDPPKRSKDKINKTKSQKSSSKHKQMKWSPYAYKKVDLIDRINRKQIKYFLYFIVFNK